MSRKHPLAECENCPLAGERFARSQTPQNATVALVSRSPGVHDVGAGKPFSGPSGKILNHLLGLYGFTRKDIITTNLVLCYSEDPPAKAIEACRPRLQSEIKDASTIIAAGAEAVNEFLGKISIRSARGVEHQKNGSRIIATSNPAAVLYDSDSFPNLVEDFKLALDPPPPVVYPEVTIINNATEARKLFKRWSGAEMIATDLEGHAPHIECAGFSINGRDAFVLPRRVIVDVWDDFKAFYESDQNWLWHNGVYDVKLLRQNGINCDIKEDTYPLSYVLDERESGVHSLEYLSRNKLGWKNYEPASVIAYKETGVLPEASEELYIYNGYDCAATWQLYFLLENAAEKDNTLNLYIHQYIPLMNALVDIELRGFKYDSIAAADLNEEIVIPKLRELVKQMAEIVGLELFNPASTKQVSAWAYDVAGLMHSLKSTRKKKFERSFSKEVRTEILEGRFDCKPSYKTKLAKFTELHDTFSTIFKQKGTYIEGLIKLVGEDGNLYCSFNPCGTVTGRTSSRRPNFQNITRTAKDVVPGIRTLFKPKVGNVLIQADYSQAELRCIAKFSDDPELLAIYRDTNRSLHRETASAFYGPDYTKDQYVRSKNINFGVCYGQSAFAFAQMYHMPKREAQDYIDAWFKRFPRVKNWIDETHKEIVAGNPLVNPFGRKRRFHLITEENYDEVLRQGVNFLPQSTASDFTIRSLCKLNSDGVPIISTVHDSIIADVPASEAMEVAKHMKDVMEHIPTMLWDDTPFKVDISMSETSWNDVQEIEI